MLPSSWLSFLVALAIPSESAFSNGRAYTIKETIDAPPGWVKHNRPPANHTVVLRIGLPQPNFHKLESHLYAVSNPDHERYGRHLSKADVDVLVAPKQESLDLVEEWLAGFGLQETNLSRSPAKDWITVEVPIALAEELLDTKYNVWQHSESGETLVRTTEYSLPSHMHDHVDLVQPTTMFGRFRNQKSTIVPVGGTQMGPAEGISAKPLFLPTSGAFVDASCKQIITISCLQQLYNAVGFVPDSGKSTIAVTGYLGQNANLRDFEIFYELQLPNVLNATFDIITANNGSNNQSPARAGDEANLDVQFAFGMSHPVLATFFSTGGSPPFQPDFRTTTNTNEPYLDWLNFILAQEDLPMTISTSYGDDEQTIPESYARRVCAGFAQLGARGVSLLFASGDSGVGDGDANPATTKCISNDGRNATVFLPAFPASCPFVTTVGGTTSIPEVAISRFFSGGGFSNYFPQPEYQREAVNAYLRTLPEGTYAGLYNPQGRAYPDVAAQSDNFQIVVGGRAKLIGGTSAACPAFSGIVALLNDHRVQCGKPPLGFLNPFLYSRGLKGLNDITVGSNPGCGTQGFNVTVGWDPVTGLGTPDFQKLKESLPI